MPLLSRSKVSSRQHQERREPGLLAFLANLSERRKTFKRWSKLSSNQGHFLRVRLSILIYWRAVAFASSDHTYSWIGTVNLRHNFPLFAVIGH